MTRVMAYEEYWKKLVGCFLGKAVGGTLGGPLEGQPGPFQLTFYDPVPTRMLPNDDLDLQVVWLEVIRKTGLPINRRSLIDGWLDHINMFPGEYGVSVRNMNRGLYAPVTGSYDNYFSDGMGAAIRSELWACLAPGDPDLAVKLAREDACADHDQAGIDAAVFNTALQSFAFIESDRETILNKAISYLPADSKVWKAVQDTRKWWSESGDWMEVRGRLLEHHSAKHWTDVAINIAFTVLGWLAGEDDFGYAICTAVNCGMDTDCTGATLASIYGIIDPKSIQEKWLSPIGMDLVLSNSMVGLHPSDDILTFCKQVAASAIQVLDYYGSGIQLSGVDEAALKGFQLRRPALPKEAAGLIGLANDYNHRESLVALSPVTVNLTYPESVSFRPGEEEVLLVSLSNPSCTPLLGEAIFHVPDGWNVSPSMHNLNLPPFAASKLALTITAPGKQAPRIYKNMLVFDFELNGMRWSTEASLLQTIPWKISQLEQFPERCAASSAVFVEAEAHSQTLLLDRGIQLLETEIKFPLLGEQTLVLLSNRPFKAWLDGELIQEHDGKLYIPAAHRGPNHQAVVQLFMDPCWRRLVIAVDDGEPGEIHLGSGVGPGYNFLYQMEWRSPRR